MTKLIASNDQDLVKFRHLIPGIMSTFKRLPSVVKATRAALNLSDEDTISLGWKLEENARLYPDKPAILFENQRLTHKEFNAAINRYCHLFLSRGLKKGDAVNVMIENRPELLFVVGGLAKIGVIASLINTNQRDQALLHSLNVTKSQIFIIGEELIDAFEEVKPGLDFKRNRTLYFIPDKGLKPMPEGYTDLPRITQNQPVANPPTTAEVQAKDPICYIFTSGTTGMPKAAFLENRRWLASMYGFGKTVMDLSTDDVLYCTLPLFHSAAFAIGWPVAAANGAAFAIRRKFSVSSFWKDARKYNATAFVYIGELCRYLLNQPVVPEDSGNLMKKCIGNGLRPDIWKEFKNRFAINQISELYGATEFGFAFINAFNIDNTVGMCMTPFAIVKYDIDEGQPVLNDKGFMQCVKKGETGLLLGEISDKVQFKGYTDKKATKKKILRNVFKPGDIWLDTGDLVRDLGCKHIQFIDRLGDTFRWKGENVSTTEVEQTINTLPEVTQAAVYGVHVPESDGRAGMTAIIPSVPPENFNLTSLAETLHKVLPHYAIPKFIRFKKELETTPTFKVKKVKLSKEGFNPDTLKDPIYVMLPGKKEYIPLKTELYQKIAKGKYRY